MRMGIGQELSVFWGTEGNRQFNTTAKCVHGLSRELAAQLSLALLQYLHVPAGNELLVVHMIFHTC
jgi:hypothetical protein